MDRNKLSITQYKKLGLMLAAAFMLSNFIFIVPAFARTSVVTSQQVQSGVKSSKKICLPLPIPVPTVTGLPISICTPTPKAAPTSSPTAQATSTPTPTPTIIAVPKTPIPIVTLTPLPTRSSTPPPLHIGTVTPTSTVAVTPTPTATLPPNSTGPLPQMSASGTFTLTASKIVGTDARLSLADPLHPILSFSAVTIQDMKLTYLSIVLSAGGSVVGSGAAIKTSVFQEFITALGSFTNKADLLILLAGGTVKTLTMTNVTLKVDRYIDMQSIVINDLSVR